MVLHRFSPVLAVDRARPRLLDLLDMVIADLCIALARVSRSHARVLFDIFNRGQPGLSFGLVGLGQHQLYRTIDPSGDRILLGAELALSAARSARQPSRAGPSLDLR